MSEHAPGRIAAPCNKYGTVVWEQPPHFACQQSPHTTKAAGPQTPQSNAFLFSCPVTSLEAVPLRPRTGCPLPNCCYCHPTTQSHTHTQASTIRMHPAITASTWILVVSIRRHKQVNRLGPSQRAGRAALHTAPAAGGPLPPPAVSLQLLQHLLHPLAQPLQPR